MNRPIKFRAWDGQKWWNDVAVYNGEPYVWNYEETALVPLFSADQIRLYGKPKLVQFTGLVDRHGTEIYEGDIIETEHHLNPMTPSSKCVVVFKQGAFLAQNPRLKSEWSLFYHRPESFHLEVLGNLYEHPELLR